MCRNIYVYITGKSMSEALIFASNNPQYDNRLFIELKVEYVHENCKLRTCSEHVVYVMANISHDIYINCSECI